MNLDNSCSIPAGLLRLLKFAEEDATHPISWNLQKSRDGSYSLKFWTEKSRGITPLSRAKTGAYSDNRNWQRKGTNRPRAETTVAVDKPCTLDSSKLPPKILETPKSSGRKRKSKPPSKVKRNRQRRAAWSRHQQLRRENLQATAKLLGCSARSLAVVESSPEPGSSGPELLSVTTEKALEKPCGPDFSQPEGVSQETTVLVEETPSETTLQESASTVVDYPNTLEGSDTDCSSTHSGLLDLGDRETPATNPKPQVPDWCVNCGEGEGTLRSCSACKAVKYCSVRCQKDNWCEHKLSCKELKSFFQL